MSTTRRRPSRKVPPKPCLPSKPLADAILALAARETLGAVCERAGVPERVVARWRLGEVGGHVDLDLADRALTNLGLFWWEVWTEGSVREPLFVVTTYNHRWKLEKDGERRVRRVKDRTVPYGDLGTDFYRLREIELLMVGEPERVAA